MILTAKQFNQEVKETMGRLMLLLRECPSREEFLHFNIIVRDVAIDLYQDSLRHILYLESQDERQPELQPVANTSCLLERTATMLAFIASNGAYVLNNYKFYNKFLERVQELSYLWEGEH